MIDRDAINQVAGIVVDLLVDGDYGALASMTRNRRLLEHEIREAIEEYGETLVYPPSESWDAVEIIEIDGAQPPAFHVDVPLWTVEDGESDLFVELEMIERHQGVFAVELLNIRVQ